MWFDSGTSHAAVLKPRPELWHHDGEMGWQADMYLEGSRPAPGLVPQLAFVRHGHQKRTSRPTTSVLTHGFVVDGDGRKMSKSLGNVIAPGRRSSTSYGAEILRLWVAAEDYTDDIRHLRQRS